MLIFLESSKFETFSARSDRTDAVTVTAVLVERVVQTLVGSAALSHLVTVRKPVWVVSAAGRERVLRVRGARLGSVESVGVFVLRFVQVHLPDGTNQAVHHVHLASATVGRAVISEIQRFAFRKKRLVRVHPFHYGIVFDGFWVAFITIVFPVHFSTS